MKREHYRSIKLKDLRSFVTKALLSTAVAYLFFAVGPYNQTFGILIEAVKEKMHPTAPEFLTQENIPHAGVLAVLGGGIYPVGTTYDISTFQKRRERAAAIGIVDLHMADKVLLLDGVTPDGVDGDLTKKFFISQEQSLANGGDYLPAEKIMVEKESTSTATNLDGLKKYMKENNINTAIVVTDEFHRIRTEALIKIKKIKAVVVTVEQLARMHNHYEMLAVVRQNASPGMKWRNTSETVKLFTLFLDPEGEASGQLESLFVK